MANKINILIISTYYPPTISIASNRILAISKYLSPQFFNITVLTYGKESNFKAPKNVKVIRINNKGLINRLTFENPRPYIIHKSKALYNKVLAAFLVDEWLNWRKAAFKYIKTNFLHDEFDFVISSYGPASAHLLTLQMRNAGYKFKWIADMRDQMSKNLTLQKRQRESFKKIEKNIFNEAIAISSATQLLNNNFFTLSQGKGLDCFEMKNGFDFEIPKNVSYNEIFTISYVGTFYGLIKPDLFLKAITELLANGLIKDIKVRFVGVTIPVSIPDILKNKVMITSKIAHNKAINIMKSSDANLFIMSHLHAGAVPGKVYEYLACLKPIIGVFDAAENQQLVQILNNSGLAFLSEFNDYKILKENILKVYKNWIKKTKYTYNLGYIQQFHRKEQVKIMEEYILKNAHG